MTKVKAHEIKEVEIKGNELTATPPNEGANSPLVAPSDDALVGTLLSNNVKVTGRQVEGTSFWQTCCSLSANFIAGWAVVLRDASDERR